MNYYKIINGVKYDAKLIDAVDKAVAGQGDGRISKKDAEVLIKIVKDGNTYTDVEKITVEFIRSHYKWTTEADEYFRTEIRKWAVTK